MGSDRITVGPLGVFTQVEDEVFVVLGFPGLGHGGEHFTLGAGGDETFEQVTQNIGFNRSFGFMRVESCGLGAVAFHQLLNLSQLGTCGHIGGLCRVDTAKQSCHQ